MNDFTLYFGGSEVPGWRALLAELGVHGMSMTYWNLKRRMPKKATWKLADHIPGDISILIESGAYTANKDPGQMTTEEWEKYDLEYRTWVGENLDAIDLVTEFDSSLLGDEYIQRQRDEFWRHIPLEKFMPVWHERHGLTELEHLATTYDHIAIPSDALNSSARIAAKINTLAQRFGTEFHGAAITKPDILLNVRFASAASTSWLSPIKFGDTIVWDGTRLRRYPKKYKDDARKRHRMAFIKAGYDAQKIADGDPTEVAKFTVWSWLQLEAAVGKRRHARPFDVIEGDPEADPVTGWAEEDDDDSAQTEGGSVARHPSMGARVPVARQERRILPVLGLEGLQEPGEGEESTIPQVVLSTPVRRSQRKCDTCYISGSCPAFEPAGECAYDFPIEIRTPGQAAAARRGIIEIAIQRLAFAHFAEQVEGGYPDPNVSTEIDRVFRLMRLNAEIEDTRETLDISVKAKAGAGALSRIFGGGGEAPALPVGGLDKIETDRLLQGAVATDIMDAEVVDE